MQLPDGLYEVVLSATLEKALAELYDPSTRTLEPLCETDSHERLAEALTRQLVKVLEDVQGDLKERTQKQLELVNALLAHLREHYHAAAQYVESLQNPPRILRSVHRKCPAPMPPETGLTVPWLFTAGKGSPSLLTELRRELAGCNQADVLVSFITVSGVRKIMDVLQALTSVGASGQSKARLRVLTTTYTGATEARAVDLLSALPGCEIKVSLDGRRTRLHAKAWIFRLFSRKCG